jgi:GntR family transcriptional regulator, trigonelline degradation regulator
MSELRIVHEIKTLRQLMLDKLHVAIVRGYIPPGSRLVERTLCDELGVSRTIVREVLRHLETEGLVGIAARQGPVVARLNPGQVGEIYELRGLVEANAARACAERSTIGLVKQLRRIRKEIEAAVKAEDLSAVLAHTERFYDALFEGAQRTVSLAVVKTLDARINRLRVLTISAPGRSIESNREMNRMLDLIERYDGDAAAAASITHIKRTTELALFALAQQGEVEAEA